MLKLTPRKKFDFKKALALDKFGLPGIYYINLEQFLNLQLLNQTIILSLHATFWNFKLLQLQINN